VLFLPKEEGGQGLVHLPSRHATFRLQFIQKFLTGPVDLWRKMTKRILQSVDGLGLDAALFLMDAKQLQLAGVPRFYCELFKVWGLLDVCRLEETNSLYWLLEEPLIKGARMDIASENVLGLTQILCASKTVALRHIVNVAGPEMSDINAVATLLGQR